MISNIVIFLVLTVPNIEGEDYQSVVTAYEKKDAIFKNVLHFIACRVFA